VIHLSLRGKAEFDTIKGAFDWESGKQALVLKNGEDLGVGSLTEYIGVMQSMSMAKWVASQKPENAIQVAAFPFDPSDMAALRKSVERGHQMFTGKATDDKDEKIQKWAKAANCVSCHTDYGRQSLFRWDDWATLVRPNNLTNGVYRGGRRPVDFYYRIHSGINGSGMANFGSSLPTEAIWDLVNFVRTLPYPAMRQQFAINVQ
jgi:mono/diheme cytochrome c family protein